MDNIGLKKLKFWNQFKGFPFKTNMILYLVVVTLAIVFSFLSNSLLKLALVIPLAISTGMVTIPALEFISSFSETIKLMFKLEETKPIYSASISEEISSIASQMRFKGTSEFPLKVLSGWLNAGMTRNGSMILGQPIVEEFDKNERQGVIGHELGHRKGYHWIKRIVLLVLIFPLLYYFTQLPFPFYINYLILFAVMGLIMPFISWPFEYQADAFAAKSIGAEKVISGLVKLASKADMDMDLDSYSHPSIARRINRLYKKFRS